MPSGFHPKPRRSPSRGDPGAYHGPAVQIIYQAARDPDEDCPVKVGDDLAPYRVILQPLVPSLLAFLHLGHVAQGTSALWDCQHSAEIAAGFPGKRCGITCDLSRRYSHWEDLASRRFCCRWNDSPKRLGIILVDK